MLPLSAAREETGEQWAQGRLRTAILWMRMFTCGRWALERRYMTLALLRVCALDWHLYLILILSLSTHIRGHRDRHRDRAQDPWVHNPLLVPLLQQPRQD